MKIRYEKTVEDLIAFFTYHLDHSASYQRLKTFLVWFGPALSLLVFGVNRWLDEDPASIIPVAIGYSVLAAIWVLIIPPVLRWTTLREVRKAFSEGTNKGHSCLYELELTHDGLIERCQIGESKTLWPGIAKVVSTNEHTFIYVGATAARIVPREAVSEGNYEVFVDALKDRLDQEQLKARGCQDW